MENVIIVLLILQVIWLIILSASFFKLVSLFRKIGAKSLGADDFIDTLKKLIESQDTTQNTLKQISSHLGQIDGQIASSIQHIGLVRYNPFNETGGDHSFSLALLDRNNNGFVLTCLHTRDRTRVYLKPTVNGESSYELSTEEKKALKEANKNSK
jgi:hypothetical protein